MEPEVGKKQKKHEKKQ